MKTCPACGEQKSADEYRRNASRADGLSFYCKKCFKAITSDGKPLIATVGLTEDKVRVLSARQADVCAICLRPLNDKPHVDHDHETGEVRGILCFSCNGGLGQFGDNVRRLQRAIDYLRGELQAPRLIAPGVYDMTAFYERPGA